jgi:hypothetical protein
MTDTIVISVDGTDTITIPNPHPSLAHDIEIHGEDGRLIADSDESVEARLVKNQVRYTY